MLRGRGPLRLCLTNIIGMLQREKNVHLCCCRKKHRIASDSDGLLYRSQEIHLPMQRHLCKTRWNKMLGSRINKLVMTSEQDARASWNSMFYLFRILCSMLQVRILLYSMCLSFILLSPENRFAFLSHRARQHGSTREQPCDCADM